MKPLDILWYSRSMHPCPLGLAAQLGWFLDEFRDDGIRVFTSQGSSDPALRDAHLDHHLKHSIRQGGNAPAIWARACGVQTKVIALSWTDEFQGILSRGDSALTSPASLRGQRLALPVCGSRYIDSTRTESLHGLLVALGSAGLGPGDIKLVDIAADIWSHTSRSPGVGKPYGEYGRQIDSLLRNEVDVIYVKGARGLEAARAAGAQVLLDLRDLPDPAARVHTGTPRPITVDQALLDEHPEVVERFLARVIAVGYWAASHPDETVAYLSRETGSAERFVREAYGNGVHLHLGSDLADRSVQALKSHSRFLLDWGFVPRAVDIDAWIDPRPLAGALRRLAERDEDALDVSAGWSSSGGAPAGHTSENDGDGFEAVTVRPVA